MPVTATVDYFRERWRGAVPMRRLFGRDTLVVASLINLVASAVGLYALATGAPGWVAVALHLAPVPYNLFLLLAIGRSPQRSTGIELLAGLWFVLMLLI